MNLICLSRSKWSIALHILMWCTVLLRRFDTASLCNPLTSPRSSGQAQIYRGCCNKCTCTSFSVSWDKPRVPAQKAFSIPIFSSFIGLVGEACGCFRRAPFDTLSVGVTCQKQMISIIINEPSIVLRLWNCYSITVFDRFI